MQIGASRLEPRKGATMQVDRHGSCRKKIGEPLGLPYLVRLGLALGCWARSVWRMREGVGLRKGDESGS